MKKQIRLWLEENEIRKLKIKANQLGFKERGALSHYVSKIANESVIFIEPNIKVILELKE